MSGIRRFSVSLEEELLKPFDDLVARRRYSSRSQGVRELLAEKLAEMQLRQPNANAVGSVTIVYDHDRRELLRRITDVQHGCAALIRSSIHVHLDRHECLEVIVVVGTVKKIVEFSDTLIGIKGVRHGKLSLTVPA